MSLPLIESLDTLIVDLPTIRPHKLAMHTLQQQTLVDPAPALQRRYRRGR